MSSPSATGFPVNLGEALRVGYENVDGIDKIFLRRLRATDPNNTLCIFQDNWKPIDFEIGGRDVLDPVLSRYQIGLSFMVKVAGDQPSGEARAAHMAKIIRTMLYRDGVVAVALRSCSETLGFATERVSYWKVEEQKFFDTVVKNMFIFISTTRLMVETQTV